MRDIPFWPQPPSGVVVGQPGAEEDGSAANVSLMWLMILSMAAEERAEYL